MGERRAYDEVHARANLSAACYDAFGQFDTFGGKRVHLPVAGNDFLSHFRLYFIWVNQWFTAVSGIRSGGVRGR
ncbi:hypothetical protein, partial [uncultured Duncaniella sp.]|uniref:hypothetical protein n=1 Tax=uncultured Duncaniella sp. TaxID=2768039 RepID=UPI002618534F